MNESAESDLAQMREDYSGAGLHQISDPVSEVRRWIADAVATGAPEPNAMALATATPDGRPSVRMVLLKSFDERGAVFYTNYDSRKGRELADNPHAAATMWWPELQRQIRIEGAVAKVSAAESDAYFAGRPRASQIGSVGSPQSSVVPDAAALEARRLEVERRFDGRDVKRPQHWGGFRIALDVVEFWLGRSGRWHDRTRFTLVDGAWSRDRLAP